MKKMNPKQMILWLLDLSLIFVLSAFKKQIQMKGIAQYM